MTRAFFAALRPDVTVEHVEQPGALPVTAVLALRSWWDRRRRGH